MRSITQKKINVIFTLDYEIHGNGDGSPYELMVEPTYRLMDLLEKYQAKLTILADVAEIFCFYQYLKDTGNDKFHYQEIVKQLQEALRRGHDVQLHIHSSYFKAQYNGKSWVQHWPEYNMAALPYQRIQEMVSLSVTWLNEILKPHFPEYRCHVFRAANWSMMPTENIYRVLVENGIDTDTSVYKGGKQAGNVSYDYTQAYSNMNAYKADISNINKFDANGKLIEYPIYCEMRYFWSFITPLRIFRMVRARFHKHQKVEQESLPDIESDTNKFGLKSFLKKNPWKLDFNQASGYQLIMALERIKLANQNDQKPVNVVLIGHSKTFVRYNEKSLGKFLKWCSKEERIEYCIFK